MDELNLLISLKILEMSMSSLDPLLTMCEELVVLGLFVEVVAVVRDWRHELCNFWRGAIRSPENPGFSKLFWGLLGTILIALGVAGEVSVHVKSEKIEVEMRNTSDILVAVIDGKAKVATDRALQAEKDVQVVTQRNLMTRGMVLNLEAKVAARHLPPEQKAEIARTLIGFAEQRFSIFAVSGDPEIIGIADDIAAALTRPNGADWALGAWASGPEPHGRAIAGVLVEVKKAADPRSLAAAKALVSALNSVHVATAGPSERNDSGNVFMGLQRRPGVPIIDQKIPITITIGRKP
jgi:hypothetical protein